MAKNIPQSSTVAALKGIVQRLTGIHKVSQRLVFAGTPLKDEDLLSATSLVDGCSLFVLVNKSFPASLGPFETASVPWSNADFQLPPLGKEFDEQGSMWLMEQRPLTRLGVRAQRGVEFPLVGQFSPPHPVTLTDEEKAAIGVPAAARRFVWSYPVAGWRSVEGDDSASSVVSFLSVGGFVYLDSRDKVIHATTLLPSALDAGGLQFRRPTAWRPEWTAALMKQGRFQRITIKPLNDIGAHHFCWLRPGELVMGSDGRPCEEQPQVPHGGFAYLFHSDVFSSDAEALVLDRYFACASGDEYVAMDEHERELAATGMAALGMSFEKVSELETLHELHERAAAQPRGAESSELQQQIDQLEMQLQQATKCIACTDQDKDTVLNCGHVCLCHECAPRVNRCPMCRANITERRRVFQG